MISFDTENKFNLNAPATVNSWLNDVIQKENHQLGELAYIFCSDSYLHDINKKFLNHDTLTDIITFDYVEDNIINGEIYISTERVKENALDFDVSFDNELRRVMVHGVLHLCGHKDESDDQKGMMRKLEDKYLKLYEEEIK